MRAPDPDYIPLDLRQSYNPPVTIFEDPEEVALGERTLHGLPFSFGGPEAAVVRADPGAEVRIAVGDDATWLVFAHAVLEPDLYSGGEIGETVGAYRVRYTDGEVVEASLSQRYEIGPHAAQVVGARYAARLGADPLSRGERCRTRAHGSGVRPV